jgi:hypothetical protein
MTHKTTRMRERERERENPTTASLPDTCCAVKCLTFSQHFTFRFLQAHTIKPNGAIFTVRWDGTSVHISVWKVRCIVNNTANWWIILLYDFGWSNYTSNFAAFCHEFLKLDCGSRCKGKRCGPRTIFCWSLTYALCKHWLLGPYRIIIFIYGWEYCKVLHGVKRGVTLTWL